MTSIQVVRVIQVVQEEASKYGVSLSEKDANAILWEHTGYPEFWHIPEDGATPEECCRKQLKEFFSGQKTEAL